MVGVVFVVIGATTFLKAIPRESYCGRLLISRNFGASSEIVSVINELGYRLCRAKLSLLTISVVLLFRSGSLLRALLAVL